ncbi:MAG: phosphate acyltransferase PlsX [Alphaproteobacteria bacterium]
MSRDLVVSVDAMGGDHAPGVEIDGLDRSLIRHPETRFLIFGDQARIESLLANKPRLKKAVDVRHAPDRVAMDAKPSAVVRRGQQTSMWLAVEAVKSGEASVAVSSGNTGALMAIAKRQLRTLPSINRPAIAAIWPTTDGECIVLDVGANLDCSERELVDFALMGEAFARATLGLPRPRVGLLNVGSEDLKGTEAVRQADQILRSAGLPIDYHGFVEGNDIGIGTTDVVVTDGFTGNIALKTAEGTARQIAAYLRSAIGRSLFGRIGYLFASGAFRVLRAKMDPRNVNGGVFLGLNGIVVKSHGGTDAIGFASALDLAIDMGRSDFDAEIASASEILGRYVASLQASGDPAAVPQ